jgi:hypothetical protein
MSRSRRADHSDLGLLRDLWAFEAPRANLPQMKGSDADPGLPIVSIQFELLRNEMPNHGRRKIPVSEEQIVPHLDHDPMPLSHMPGQRAD